jgi:hypothetical protein
MELTAQGSTISLEKMVLIIDTAKLIFVKKSLKPRRITLETDFHFSRLVSTASEYVDGSQDSLPVLRKYPDAICLKRR